MPNSPKNVFEVVVKKFGATSLHTRGGMPDSTGTAGTPNPRENLATVSPKKRIK